MSEGPAVRSRRSFLDLLLSVSVLGWLGSILFPIVKYLTPLPSSGPGGPVRLSPEQIATLTRKNFVIVPAHGQRVMVFQAGSALKALSARCTHEGCTVKFVPNESLILCACHNGRFDLDGRVLSGPPPRPLEQFTAQQDEDGGVLVTVERA